MVTQYIKVLQSYGNPNTLKCFNILKCFNLMKVTIGLQHFNILDYHRIAILQYIAYYLFLQRTLTVHTHNPEFVCPLSQFVSAVIFLITETFFQLTTLAMCTILQDNYLGI